MQLDPKLLALPDFTVEEIQRCLDVTEPGMYDTGLIVDANNCMYRYAFAKDVLKKMVTDAWAAREARLTQEVLCNRKPRFS